MSERTRNGTTSVNEDAYAKRDERLSSRCSCRRSAGGAGETRSRIESGFEDGQVSPDPTKTAATNEHRRERSEQSNRARVRASNTPQHK